MVGSLWDYRLLGEVWASGLHAHFVDVEILIPEESLVVKTPVAGLHNAIDRITGITSNIFLQ
jgi:hypothetical protein